MPSNFPLAPRIPVPAPNPEFDRGIQFQEDNVDVGPKNPTFVSFNGSNVAATYDPDTDTVNVDIASGGSGGGGVASIVGASVAKQNSQSTGATAIFDDAASPRFNVNNRMDTSTGVYTLQSGDAGVHSARASVRVQNNDSESSHTVTLRIVLNRLVSNLAVGQDTLVEITSLSSRTLHLDAGMLVLADGDTLEVRNISEGGFSANVTAEAGDDVHFTVQRIGDTPA